MYMSSLSEIINKSNTSPIIVNEKSNFVVVTYWWGRGNWNGNLARPCISFFEEIKVKVIAYAINFYVMMLIEQKKFKINDVTTLINHLSMHFDKNKDFNNIIEKYSKSYLDSIYETFNIIGDDKFNKAKHAIEISKREGTTSPEFVLFEPDDIHSKFKEIMIVVLEMNKEHIFDVFHTNKNGKMIKKIFFDERDVITNEEREEYKSKILFYKKEKDRFNELINSELKKKTTYTFFGKEFINSNIYDVLHKTFRYYEPVQFETMIEKWKTECAKFNCNHMAIEYPEFAGAGGYQMAINAKPLFIQKALELCTGRNVLYIDGDMFIRKYPHIFDMENVDFMARGWSIDPRSSYRMDESITYDPYIFETSGGIMFFSQSHESKQLIKEWIKESANPKQSGKADDRILSLIFNTKKFVLNMNIIQLPIEYLWLSLDYDDRLVQHYNDNKLEMQKTIYVEHPECLTSEETASGAGASKNRNPMYYRFLEMDEAVNPVSEEMHEYFMFPDKLTAAGFETYLNYMATVTYMDDGNQKLIENNFVYPDNPENNESPLYITKYDDKYGTKNEIYRQNAKMGNMFNDEYIIENKILKIANGKLAQGPFGFIEVDESVCKVEEQIPLILGLLARGHNVLFRPTGMLLTDYSNILSYADNTNLELIFFPIMPQMVHIFKPVINLKKPILFRGLQTDISRIMIIRALAMFKTLSDFSDQLTYGSYEILSRIRIGYAFTKVTKVKKTMEIKGGSKSDMFIKEYEDGLHIMYGSGYSKKYKRRTTTKMSRRNRRRSLKKIT